MATPPPTLPYVDHRSDPAAWATALGVSVEACELLLDSPFIDLHLDLEVPVRLLGYDPAKHHGHAVRRPIPFFGHTDYPRLIEGGFSGVVYDIATNIARPERNRHEATLRNIDASLARIAAHPAHLRHVTTRSEYDAAVADGRLALFLSLQGGNALAHDPSVLDGELGRLLHRITFVHLTSSVLGGTNSPLGRDRGATNRGRDFVAACNRNRVLVDLAHSGKRTFWDVVQSHSREVPLIVSHTGVDAVRSHWRNVDDAQIRAIADRGGVIGVMYQSSFLEKVLLYGSRASIVDHLAHVIDVVGEDYAAIGTDYDGMIIPPADLPDVTHHPLLVQDMLDRGWRPERIRKILGENYLRVVADTRP